MPGVGRRFAKGNPGRKPGSRNRVSREIRDIARGLLEDGVYQRKLRLRLLAGTAPQVETLLYHYAYGKPQDSLAVTGMVPTVDPEAARASLREKLAALLVRLPVESPVDDARETRSDRQVAGPAESYSAPNPASCAPAGVHVLSADAPVAPAPPDPPSLPASGLDREVLQDRGGVDDADGALALADRLSVARSPRLWRTRR